MGRVPIRELNQHTADVMARVEGGERVQITRNGVLVAVIEPARPSPLTALIESGELRPATARLPLFSANDVPAPDSAGSDAVRDDRSSDTRW